MLFQILVPILLLNLLDKSLKQVKQQEMNWKYAPSLNLSHITLR